MQYILILDICNDKLLSPFSISSRYYLMQIFMDIPRIYFSTAIC